MKEFIDKLIEALEEAKNRANRHYNYGDETAYRHSIEIVNQLAEEYAKTPTPNHPILIDTQQYIAELERKLKEKDWIPVSKRLPERFAEYIVMIEGAEKPTTLYYCPEDECPWQDDENDYNVIAWQPLPVPYQPKGE